MVITIYIVYFEDHKVFTSEKLEAVNLLHERNYLNYFIDVKIVAN